MPTIMRALTGPIRVLVIASILLVAASCDQSSTQLVDSTSERGELRITPAESMIDNGSTIQLEAHRVFPDGRAIPVSGTVTWTSSSSAVGSVSSAGVVTARLPGEVTIRAETEREDATAKIEILPVSADLRLEVADEIEAEAGEGEEAQISARVVDVTGRAIQGVQVDFQMTHASGEEVSIRRVSGSDGFAHVSVPVGTQAGVREMEITSPGFGESSGASLDAGGAVGADIFDRLRRLIRILVRASHPDLVTVSPELTSLEVGDVERLDVEVVDNYGNEVTDPTLTWSADNTQVVEVDERGELRAIAAGQSSVAVRATDRRGRSAEGTADVEVRAGSQPAAAAVEAHAGNGQQGSAGAALPGPLAVRVSDQQGSGVPGVSVQWTVTNGSATLSRSSSTTDSRGIASVNVELGGTTGPVEVQAEVPSVGAVAFRVAVAAGPVASIGLAPETMTLELGGSHRITATVQDEFGNRIESPSIDWSTSNSDVAAVNGDGRVTGLSSGRTTITARAGDREGTTEVQVSGGAEPASLHIGAPSGDLTAIGEALQLAVSARNPDGESASLPNSITWSTSNPDVASVNSTGRVIANAVGTAFIGVAAACCTSDSVMVRVTQEVATVSVSPANRTLEIGARVQLNAQALDSRGNSVSNAQVTWSSDAPSVASVGSSGMVSGIEAGQAGITASVEGQSGTATIHVEGSPDDGDDNGDDDSDGGDDSGSTAPGEVDDLTVIAASANSLTLRFREVSDGDGGAANYQVRYRASSEFGNWGTAAVVEAGSCGEPIEGIAVGNVRVCRVPGLSAETEYSFRMVSRRIDDETGGWGWVYGPLSNIAAGTTDTTDNGTDPGDSGDSGDDDDSGDSSTQPSSLYISAPATSLTALEQTVQLSASAEDSDGNDTDLPSSISWTSSDPGVASVNSNGRVTANAVGTALISVAAACCTGDTVAFDVSQQVASVQVSPSSLTLEPGETWEFSAEARDSRGNPVPGVGFSWSTTNTSVANVTSSGVVAAVNAGSTSVRASASGVTGQEAVAVQSSNPGSGAQPWYEQHWDYPSTAAMKSAAYYPHENHGGTVELVTGQEAGALTSTGNFLRATYDTSQDVSTAGVDLLPDDFDVETPREVWIDIMIRFNASWSQGSGGDDKTIFLLEDHSAAGGSSETNRWELHLNPGRWYGGNGSNDGFFVVSDASWTHDPADGGSMPDFATGNWERLRLHFRMASNESASDGSYRVWWNDRLIQDHALRTGSPSGAYFRNLALGRNAHSIQGSGIRDWGRVRIYTTNPGW